MKHHVANYRRIKEELLYILFGIFGRSIIEYEINNSNRRIVKEYCCCCLKVFV